MSVRRGATRIVLLRSGGYDYAELDLDRPLHLVAANNVGKTTLIAALQLLYIDDFRSMHFAHDAEKTRRHYFPTTDSLVLFECMTPTGLQVFGLRGLGPVQGYDYERFVYRGAYERIDYMIDRVLRPWADVARELVARDLAHLEPKHLRQSLTGSGDSKGPPLALVPLRRTGTYESFRFLFRNLLRLSRIEQDQLKRLFIDIAGPRLRSTGIDLQRDYADLYAKVQRQKDDVEALRNVEPVIQRLVDTFERRGELRGILAADWCAIDADLRREQEGVAGRGEELAAERADVDGRLGQLDAVEKALSDQIEALTSDLTLDGEKLQRLDALRDAARSFDESLEAAARANLEIERDRLIARIQRAKADDREQVTARLARATGERERLERVEARFADALVTWLREKAHLADDVIDDVFRILDPMLLGQVVGPGGIVVHDEVSAIARTRTLAGHISVEGFSFDEVLVPRSALRRDSAMAAYENVAAVRIRLGEARADEDELRKALRDIDEREGLVARRRDLDQKIRDAELRVKTFEEWSSGEPVRPELTQRITDTTAARELAQGERRSVSLQRADLLVRQRTLLDEEARLQEDLGKLEDEVRSLQPAEPEWPPGDPGDVAGLRQRIHRYRNTWSEHESAASRVDRLFSDVEAATTGRYLGSDEAETILRLRDELAALVDREHDVAELWKNIVDGMKSAFKALVDAVDEIRREVSGLTRKLGERRVSNLERVSVEMVPNRDLVGRLRAVLDADAMPLFAGSGAEGRATRAVVDWLEQGKRIELIELFTLRFEVVDRRGQTKRFDSLTQMESEGTSMTIKVLVHLELMKGLLADDVSLPFFLDEVGSLDDANLSALVAHATSMHFVPVVASPDARECVPTLYFLRPSKGGLILDETSRVSLKVGDADGA